MASRSGPVQFSCASPHDGRATGLCPAVGSRDCRLRTARSQPGWGRRLRLPTQDQLVSEVQVLDPRGDSNSGDGGPGGGIVRTSTPGHRGQPARQPGACETRVVLGQPIRPRSAHRPQECRRCLRFPPLTCRRVIVMMATQRPTLSAERASCSTSFGGRPPLTTKRSCANGRSPAAPTALRSAGTEGEAAALADLLRLPTPSRDHHDQPDPTGHAVAL